MNMLKGMIVTLIVIFSEIGACTPLFITVTSLDENNLSEKYVLINIKVLYVGGGGVSVNVSTCGYDVYSQVRNIDLVWYNYHKKSLTFHL